MSEELGGDEGVEEVLSKIVYAMLELRLDKYRAVGTYESTSEKPKLPINIF